MRIRTRAKIIWHSIFVFILILGSFSYLGYIIALDSRLYSETTAFQFERPWIYDNPEHFNQANYSRLAEMADYYDDHFDRFHLPLNFTASVYFTNTDYNEVAAYSYSDNGALWTGIAMAAWVFHYLTAIKENNSSDAAFALSVIRKMISGMSMMLIVPNGGLGPNYSGILARGWAGPDDKDIAPMFFYENIRHFNGTGNYSQYRWRGFTSNDEYGGFYLGMSLALKYIPDSYVQNTVRLMIEQSANYMVETNFLGISGPGGPSGVDQKPKFSSGGFWRPLLMKMASIVNPDKYLDLYYRVVSEEWDYFAASEGGPQEVLANYYAFNFAHCVVLGFLTLEGTDSAIGRHFYEGYLNSLRYYTKYHRNAWFNIIYLMTLPEDKWDDEETKIIIADIIDQLTRFDINHFPDVYYSIKHLPENTSYTTVNHEWDEWIDNHPYGGLIRLSLFDSKLYRNYTTEAQTVEYHRTGIFYWELNPFVVEQYPDWEYLLYENPGLSFTVPYWMGRYLGIIQKI